MFTKPKKIEEKLRRNVNVFLSHLKARSGYDFPLYFSHEFLMCFYKRNLQVIAVATETVLLCLSQCSCDCSLDFL